MGMRPAFTTSLPIVSVSEGSMSPRSPRLCHSVLQGAWDWLAGSSGLETALNFLLLCLHYQENQGNSDARPCPKEQGALGERPGCTQGWAPSAPSALQT